MGKLSAQNAESVAEELKDIQELLRILSTNELLDESDCLIRSK